jgi:hypothetical protein
MIKLVSKSIFNARTGFQKSDVGRTIHQDTQLVKAIGLGKKILEI